MTSFGFLLTILFVAPLRVELNGFDISNSVVPVSEIIRGGPPRDGIPSLDQPNMVPVKLAKQRHTKERILGILIGTAPRAYPISILNWHEVVNDTVDQTPVVITFCPLCGSGMAFKRTFQGQIFTFGVSGLLYQSDVLMYDRETGSLWSQLLGQAISGPMAGTKMEYVQTQETTLKAWITDHPDTLVLSDETGFARNYQRSPYGRYLRTESLMFPVAHRYQGPYHPKEKILGLLGKKDSWAIPYSELDKSSGSIGIQLDGLSLTVLYDSESQSAWVIDVSGHPYPSVTAFLFAWYTFHPNTQIYQAPHSRRPSTEDSLDVISSPLVRRREERQNIITRRKKMNSKELKITAEKFEPTIGEGVSLIDFWAPWCGPCKTQGPIVDAVARDMGDRAQVGKLNVDENQDIASRYGVSSIPTLIIFKDGQEQERLIGVRRKDELIQKLESYL